MKVSYVRYLDAYPTGRRRRLLLFMAVLASLITSYEAAIAPVVPLLLEDLGMTLPLYGAISAAAAIAGAVSGILAGRLADKFGRIRLLVPSMLLTSLLCFVMTLVTTPGELLTVRVVLSFVDGIAIACTAPLVRDFSPRMGRATAFGFWTWGPVGANFLSAAIAGATLPLFVTWQSQFSIMAALSFAVSIVIAMNLAELSPTLVATIRQTELTAVGKASEAPPRARDLLRSRAIWAHVLGISSWLVLYVTLLMYGQTMLVATFGVTVAEASQIMTAFWIVDIVVLIVAGKLSDRWQLRRPFSAVGTGAALVVLGVLVWMTANPQSTSIPALIVTGMLLGSCLALAYAPWMANFSENAEDIDPRLQGTTWGLFAFVTKVMAVVVLLVAPLVVAASGGWYGWLLVTLVCLAAFGVAIAFFEGPWRRRDLAGTPAAETVLPTPVD